MTKTIATLAVLLHCAVARAQDQQPGPDPGPAPDQNQNQPIPEPQPNQFPVPQQNGFDTNGLSQEQINEWLQEAAQRLREAFENANPGQNPGKEDETPQQRRIRGQGTRGSAGSGTNALPLISLISKTSTNSPAPGAKNLRLNFRNASLSLVLDYLSDAAGFVISTGSKVDLQGKVTVWANQPVDRVEAIRLLDTALKSSGYAATVEGNLLNIYVVDATNTEIIQGDAANDYQKIPATKDLVTQIVYVHNVEASQLISSLEPLMPTGTSMRANQGANAIVITDTRATIRRMVQLVKLLDTASVSASGVEVFPLQYADAQSMAQVVQQLFQTDSSNNRNRGGFGQFFGGGPGGFFGGDGGPGGRRDGGNSGGNQPGRMSSAKVVAVADDRSNSLVVSASDEQMQLVRNLVNQMDVQADDVTELRRFSLRYADPQETADLLANLFPDTTNQQNSNRGQFGGFGNFGRFGGFNRGGNGRSSTDQNSRQMRQARVTAVAEPRTSSVIVSAGREMMEEIAGIIHELDSDPSKKKKVTVIKVENRDPQEIMEELQAVIAGDNATGLNTTRSSQRQNGSQLNNRQQQNMQNSGNSGNNGFGNSFGNSGGQRTGR